MNMMTILLAAGGPLSFVASIFGVVALRKKTSADTARVLTETSSALVQTQNRQLRKVEVRMNRCERIQRTQAAVLEEMFDTIEASGHQEEVKAFRIRLEHAEEWLPNELAVLGE